MNMFAPVKANTIEEYLHMLSPERRETITFLHDFIQKTAPTLTPHFAYSMLGYGSFKYLNYKKEKLDWPTISLASQKNYCSLYICALENGQYMAEKYKDILGKVSVGKSCIRFKTIQDLHLPALATVIQKAAKNPGLVKS